MSDSPNKPHVIDIEAIDKNHIWHPYSSFTSANPVYTVTGASGAELTFADGRVVIDGMASWWSAIHGYNHPVLNSAAKEQIDRFSHVMFGGLTHEPAARLAEKLVSLTPAGLDKVFFADSGSVAVEVAIKMAIQYWLSKGKPEKHKLLSFRHAYHGDTFATMSVCDPVNGMHHLFSSVLPEQFFCASPGCGFDEQWDEYYLADFVRLLEQNNNSIAAVIIEPIVQGTGGMRFYSPTFLKRVRECCDAYGTLLIADEIATGFGRTGKLFACEHAGISPDILCVGKALTGGYISLAATLCSEKVARGISEGEAGVLMHGPTFMGNPLACAIANASIDLLLSFDWQQKIQAIEKQLKTELSRCLELESVAGVRALGAIGVVELKEPVDMLTLQPMLVEHGIWLRPFGKLVYMMPPYIISEEELSKLTSATLDTLRRYEKTVP